MNRYHLLVTSMLIAHQVVVAQDLVATPAQTSQINAVIESYSAAREGRDTTLLKKILTPDVDQLVSSGEWRTGIASAVQGMLASSAAAPGTRTLTVDKLRLIATGVAIVDCRYEIRNSNGTTRKMWSSFVVRQYNGEWRIAAIRNMLPAGN